MSLFSIRIFDKLYVDGRTVKCYLVIKVSLTTGTDSVCSGNNKKTISWDNSNILGAFRQTI